MDEKLIQQVKDCFKEELDLEIPDIKKPLKDVSEVDSLSLFKIMVALERKFKIKFELDSVEDAFKDIETIAKYIDSKK